MENLTRNLRRKLERVTAERAERAERDRHAPAVASAADRRGARSRNGRHFEFSFATIHENTVFPPAPYPFNDVIINTIIPPDYNNGTHVTRAERKCERDDEPNPLFCFCFRPCTFRPVQAEDDIKLNTKTEFVKFKNHRKPDSQLEISLEIQWEQRSR